MLNPTLLALYNEGVARLPVVRKEEEARAMTKIGEHFEACRAAGDRLINALERGGTDSVDEILRTSPAFANPMCPFIEAVGDARVATMKVESAKIDPTPTSPLLTDADKANLRSTTADQMAELNAIDAAAEHATRDFKKDTAVIGERLENPVDLTPVVPIEPLPAYEEPKPLDHTPPEPHRVKPFSKKR